MSTPSNVHVSTHPVLSHKITILRSSSTIPSAFRSVLRELTFHLGYEATSSLATKDIPITVPVGKDHVDHTGQALSEKVAMVPILRSGLGMVDSMLELIPSAAVHHIGMYRREMMPVQYYNRLPKKCEVDVVYVLDPIIATSNTIMSVIGILKKWGVPKIHIISTVGSEQGVDTIAKAHPDVQITIGTMDKELTKNGTLLPGIGDAGDRLFGTPMPFFEDGSGSGEYGYGNSGFDEELVHPSKRRKCSFDQSSVTADTEK